MCSLAVLFASLSHGQLSITAVSLQLAIFTVYCFLVYFQDKPDEAALSPIELEDSKIMLALEKICILVVWPLE
jgi:hypothetical protein